MSLITQMVSLPELLAGLAEEAIEFAHAALKLRRTITQENPTPVSPEEALEGFVEELADVDLYMELLSLRVEPGKIDGIIAEKKKRWEERLKERCSDASKGVFPADRPGGGEAENPERKA